jgi:hypothetical protein
VDVQSAKEQAQYNAQAARAQDEIEPTETSSKDGSKAPDLVLGFPPFARSGLCNQRSVTAGAMTAKDSGSSAAPSALRERH